MLEVRHLETSYGSSQVLFGIELHIGAGQVVTLMGRNGMGKTTTIKSICGMVAPQAGSIILEGQDIAGLPSHKIARAGIGLVPEGRQIFPNLTVKENLVATAHNLAGSPNPWTIDRVLDFFPSLASRINGMGNELSGGEQQMLAIGRAIMTNPKLLILDEATEGLAPLVRQQIWDCLNKLKQKGQSILIIDKDISAITKLADRHYLMDKGNIAWQGTSTALLAAPETINRYLGI